MNDTTKLATALIVGIVAWLVAAVALVVGILSVEDLTARRLLAAALVLWVLLLIAFFRVRTDLP